MTHHTELRGGGGEGELVVTGSFLPVHSLNVNQVCDS